MYKIEAKPIPETEENDLVQAAKLINAAKSPYRVGTGRDLGEAEEESAPLLKSRSPAAWTILGVSSTENSHPPMLVWSVAWQLRASFTK